jgi:hypothetical protein
MLIVCLLLAAACALCLCAWGPGTHLEFEARVFAARERLPSERAELIEREREAWQYGHIAADIINFKAVGGPYSHCHRWGIVGEMQQLARSEFQLAFTLGYLAHLAADTIAHNHFVPYHLARYARTKGLGHLYWEMNADRFVPEERWDVVSRLKRLDGLAQLDQLVNQTVPHKALSMSTNKAIFNHVLLVSERRHWRLGVEKLQPRAELELRREFLERFREAAVERIVAALQCDGVERMQAFDANGALAQKRALTAERGLLDHLAPRRANPAREQLAESFLEGMAPPAERPQAQTQPARERNLPRN